MGAHHYTDSAVKTAAAAANAGTCLEDGNSENNIFSNVGSAVKAVSRTVYGTAELMFETSWVILVLKISLQGLITEDTVKDCASRLFMVRMKLGEFDPPEMNPYKKYGNSTQYTIFKNV